MSHQEGAGLGVLAGLGLGVAGAVGLAFWAWSRQAPAPPALPALPAPSASPWAPRAAETVLVKRDGDLMPLPSSSAAAMLLSEAEIQDTTMRLAATVAGQPYSWGGGGPKAPLPGGSPGLRGGRGWDCSGLVAALWAALLRYPWEGPRFTSSSVTSICTPVARGDQRPGDVAAYQGHVAMVVSWPDSERRSALISASHGGADDNGDNPAARVIFWSRDDYRGGFIGFLRPKAQPVSELQARTCTLLHQVLAGQNPARLDDDTEREALRRYGGVPSLVARASRLGV